MQGYIFIPILLGIIFLALLIFVAIGYVKAPPDMAYIISGFKKNSKIVIGKASIRIPFFERLDKLNLKLIPIDVKTSNAVPTADYININVDATVNIKVSNDSQKLRLAAENFLNKPTEYIAAVAREVLEGMQEEYKDKFDFVFIDAAKSHYKAFWDLAMPLCKKDAVVVCDNVLMKAMTASDEFDKNKKYKTSIRKMREFLD